MHCTLHITHFAMLCMDVLYVYSMHICIKYTYKTSINNMKKQNINENTHAYT